MERIRWKNEMERVSVSPSSSSSPPSIRPFAAGCRRHSCLPRWKRGERKEEEVEIVVVVVRREKTGGQFALEPRKRSGKKEEGCPIGIGGKKGTHSLSLSLCGRRRSLKEEAEVGWGGRGKDGSLLSFLQRFLVFNERRIIAAGERVESLPCSISLSSVSRSPLGER